MRHLQEMALDEIKKLSCDEGFLKKLLSAKDNKEIKEVFKEKDLEISDKEIEVLKENFKKSLSEKLKNMSDEELEKVSGGGKGVAIGAGVGALISIASIVASIGYENYKHNRWKGVKVGDALSEAALVSALAAIMTTPIAAAEGAAIGSIVECLC